MIFHEFKMDVTPGIVPTVIHVKQYQTDLHLRVELYSRYGDVTFDSTPTVTIRGTKPDGVGFTKSGYVWTTSSTSVTAGFFVDEQMTAIAGHIPYEIVLEGENEDETLKTISATFYLDVQRAAMDADTITGDSDIREFETVVQQMVDEYLDDHPEKTTTVTPGSIDEEKLASSVVRDYKNSNYTISPGSIEESMLSTAVKNAYKNSNFTLGQNAVHTDNIANNEVTEGKLATAVQQEYKNDYITPQMFGAHGDGVNDDTSAIQALMNDTSGKPVYFPAGKYLMNGSVTVPGKNAWILDMGAAQIDYYGTDYAFKFGFLRNSNINLGRIWAHNGGCVLLEAVVDTNNLSQSVHSNYVNFHFVWLDAKNVTRATYQDPNYQFACVKAVQWGPNTSGVRTWMSEMRWYHGRLTGGRYGFHITRNSPNDNMSHWDFHEVVVEGVWTGFHFESAADGKTIGSFLFDGCRIENGEFPDTVSYGSYLIETIGKVTKMNWVVQQTFPYSRVSITANGNNNEYTGTDWQVYCSLWDSMRWINGDLIRTDHFYSLDGGLLAPTNSDLNTLVDPGNYYANTADIASTISNCPTSTAFTLKTEVRDGISTHGSANSRYIRQTLIDLNNIEYRRTGKTSDQGVTWTFSNWKKVTSEWVDISTSCITYDARYVSNGKLKIWYNEALGLISISGDSSISIPAGSTTIATLAENYQAKEYYTALSINHNITGEYDCVLYCMIYNRRDIIIKSSEQITGSIDISGIYLKYFTAS